MKKNIIQKIKKPNIVTPGNVYDFAGQPMGSPMVPMHPQMVRAIKQSPKGTIPPGLARYLAAKRAAKGGK